MTPANEYDTSNLIAKGSRGTLIERVCPEWFRPFCRIGLAFAGFILWMFFQSGVYCLLGFIESSFFRSSVSGFISLPILLPVWKLVPAAAGRRGCEKGWMALTASAVLLIPFVIEAFMIGMVPDGFSLIWLRFAGALLILAVIEEVVCRGFLLDILSIRNNRLTGLLLSSAIFAFLHADNCFASVAGVLNIFLVGIVFGLLRFSTNGLLYPSLLHWIWNLVTGMVFGWSVSGYVLFPSLFRPAGKLPWGSFGPEESILMTVATLGCVAVLWKSLRSSEKNDLYRI